MEALFYELKNLLKVVKLKDKRKIRKKERLKRKVEKWEYFVLTEEMDKCKNERQKEKRRRKRG